MDRALIMYPHGLGDIILLTPHLRWLYENGYKTCLMCREAVGGSRLLHDCKYVYKLTTVDNPWTSELGFIEQWIHNHGLFDKEIGMYDWGGVATHTTLETGEHKIDGTSREMGIDLKDKTLEVFIPGEIKEGMATYVHDNYPDGFILRHTDIEFHTEHTWDSGEYIKEHFEDLPVVNTGLGGDHYRKWSDINKTLQLAKLAKHRVLSSSVMVHAADAMGVDIDVINYGKEDKKVWPLDQDRVKHIRENGVWLK